MVSTEPGALQVAALAAAREAEADVTKWRSLCARLAGPEVNETRWPEALAEARAALAEGEMA
jgi:hypothetical protein